MLSMWEAIYVAHIWPPGPIVEGKTQEEKAVNAVIGERLTLEDGVFAQMDFFTFFIKFQFSSMFRNELIVGLSKEAKVFSLDFERVCLVLAH